MDDLSQYEAELQQFSNEGLAGTKLYGVAVRFVTADDPPEIDTVVMPWVTMHEWQAVQVCREMAASSDDAVDMLTAWLNSGCVSELAHDREWNPLGIRVVELAVVPF